ncbi:hypothetical protein [Actinomadura rupiterrae]|uniref:hypothetical protein n=1 Tax=Actinomadura rupiterrae TaxID=559627 RepID=UPI0020A2D3D9|nr:hypothetical protein [Actinomadura rupiterrae]MCP2335642.1 hypothetical protein [Actinomadura rupiterrae]
MPKSWMIADFLRPYAQWRIDRAEERDDGRNARAAIGLIDAAAYAMQLDDSDRVIVRLAIAGCFAFERFNPGVEGERLIRRWHYDDTEGTPGDLLTALADAAERGIGPDSADPPSRPSTRWRTTDRPHRNESDEAPSTSDDAAAFGEPSRDDAPSNPFSDPQVPRHTDFRYPDVAGARRPDGSAPRGKGDGSSTPKPPRPRRGENSPA